MAYSFTLTADNTDKNPKTQVICNPTWAETVIYLFLFFSPWSPFKSLITSSAITTVAVILSVLHCQSHGNINRNLFLNSCCRKQQKKRSSACQKILNVERMKKTSIFCESQTHFKFITNFFFSTDRPFSLSCPFLHVLNLASSFRQSLFDPLHSTIPQTASPLHSQQRRRL